MKWPTTIVKCSLCPMGIVRILKIPHWWGIPVCGNCLKYIGPPMPRPDFDEIDRKIDKICEDIDT